MAALVWAGSLAAQSGDLAAGAASPPAAAVAPSPISPAAKPTAPAASASKKSWFHYGKDGLDVGSDDGLFSSRINFRSQMRFTEPFESPPGNLDEIDAAGENDLRFRRLRFKMRGHLLKPWIAYKYDLNLLTGNVLGLSFDVGPEWLRLRVGQWRVDYSRERADSSGKQQFADRSIVNRTFTLDRQKGAMAVGRLAKNTWADSEYNAGLFTGHGTGLFRRNLAPGADDGSPMWALRYQWNPLGGGVAFSQSDLLKSRKARLSLAVGAAGNRSAYTRFSSIGGSQLDGFAAGLPGQYSLRQQVEEVAFKRRGLSIQHEWHWKRIFDNVQHRATRLRGSYLQSGYFFHETWSRIPEQLEIAGRVAFVDPDAARPGDHLSETAAAVNWFFRGHGDKLTFDVGRYSVQQNGGTPQSRIGVRGQWDVTF